MGEKNRQESAAPSPRGGKVTDRHAGIPGLQPVNPAAPGLPGDTGAVPDQPAIPPLHR